MGKAIKIQSGENTKINFPIIKVVWSSTADPISYTYTVQQKGCYIAAAVRGDGGGTITTTASSVITLNTSTSSRNHLIYIINAEVGNTITFSISNYSSSAYRGNNAFLAKVSKKINLVSTVTSIRGSDTTISSSPTYNPDNLYLAIQMSCGSGRSSSRSIPNPNVISSWASDSMYISIAKTYESVTASFSQHGDTAGGPTIYIAIIKT